MVYFDNAATSGLKPMCVTRAVNNALKNYSANPGRSGYKTSLEASYKIYETRQKVADFFGANSPENVAFTLNCTHSLNCILKGVLRSKDHIIVSNLEHNAIMRPLSKLVAEQGIEMSVADVSPFDEITVKNFRKCIKSNTKLILCTHASNVTGEILPIEEIGKLSAEYGLRFGVDAAQTAGVIEINMQKMNIDYLAVAPHKGLYAPMGIGILIALKPIEFTVLEGGTGTASLELSQPEDMPERLESGTVNVPGIFGVSSGIDFVKKQGAKNLYNAELGLIKRLYTGLKENKKVVLYTSEPTLNKCVPVLPFNVISKTSDETATFLFNRNIAVRAGFHCAPSAHRALDTLSSGCVRVSTGFFNNSAEIDYLLQVLKKI